MQATRLIMRSGYRPTPRIWLLVVLMWSISPIVQADEEPDDATTDFLFYPEAPNEPRLQYLTKFSTRMDVSTKGQGFRNLVFGGEENEEKLVVKPYGLAIFDGAIYVVDTRGSGYAVFDFSAGKGRRVQGSGAGLMQKPINITIDADGTRYVTDTNRNLVLVFDKKDRFLRSFGAPGEFQPVDVAIVGDRLYVLDMMHHQVQVLNKLTGEHLFTFGESGSGDGQLFMATNMAVGPDETLYVTDTLNFRIVNFTLDGEFIRNIGQVGTSPGSFARPKGLTLDREGRIYVVDSAFMNVQVLDNDGSPLTFFGGPQETKGAINLPTVVKIDYDNVDYFRQYAAPGFEIEYLVLVASQFGPNKVVVYGFGQMSED